MSNRKLARKTKPHRVKHRSQKAGLPPGSVIYTGEQKVENVRITVLDYDETNFEERHLDNIADAFVYKSTPTVSWINIDGLHNESVIEKIGKHYDLHPLIQEDIVSTAQRPKLEDFDTYLYVVLRMLHYDDAKDAARSEQVSLILGQNFVISFQESIGDVFDPIRDRIRNAKGRIRKMGADYLVYALLDAIVDNYFVILEHIGEQVETLEEELVTDPTQATLGQIYQLKREMIYLRKGVWPLREMIGNLERSESSLFVATTTPYLRDVYDHTIQVIDTVESYRDMVSGMLDTHLSSLSNRMNNVMKVLTIIATIFIPLTFVAGIYGMNFENMPELKWKYGYAGVWAIMLTILIGMLVYFKRKKWL
ncbi:magnesium/cobalt transporter CorA [Planctomycetota bacterium]